MPLRAKHHFGSSFSWYLLGVTILVLDQLFKRYSRVWWLHERSVSWMVATIVLLVVSLLLLARCSERLSNPMPLVLIIVGSLSNCFDLVSKKGVINYWLLAENTNSNYYTTNIADIVIWFGLIWLIIELLTKTIWQRLQSH